MGRCQNFSLCQGLASGVSLWVDARTSVSVRDQRAGLVYGQMLELQFLLGTSERGQFMGRCQNFSFCQGLASGVSLWVDARTSVSVRDQQAGLVYGQMLELQFLLGTSERGQFMGRCQNFSLCQGLASGVSLWVDARTSVSVRDQRAGLVYGQILELQSMLGTSERGQFMGRCQNFSLCQGLASGVSLWVDARTSVCVRDQRAGLVYGQMLELQSVLGTSKRGQFMGRCQNFSFCQGLASGVSLWVDARTSVSVRDQRAGLVYGQMLELQSLLGTSERGYFMGRCQNFSFFQGLASGVSLWVDARTSVSVRDQQAGLVYGQMLELQFLLGTSERGQFMGRCQNFSLCQGLASGVSLWVDARTSVSFRDQRAGLVYGQMLELQFLLGTSERGQQFMGRCQNFSFCQGLASGVSLWVDARTSVCVRDQRTGLVYGQMLELQSVLGTSDRGQFMGRCQNFSLCQGLSSGLLYGQMLELQSVLGTSERGQFMGRCQNFSFSQGLASGVSLWVDARTSVSVRDQRAGLVYGQMLELQSMLGTSERGQFMGRCQNFSLCQGLASGVSLWVDARTSVCVRDQRPGLVYGQMLELQFLLGTSQRSQFMGRCQNFSFCQGLASGVSLWVDARTSVSVRDQRPGLVYGQMLELQSLLGTSDRGQFMGRCQNFSLCQGLASGVSLWVDARTSVSVRDQRAELVYGQMLELQSLLGTSERGLFMGRCQNFSLCQGLATGVSLWVDARTSVSVRDQRAGFVYGQMLELQSVLGTSERGQFMGRCQNFSFCQGLATGVSLWVDARLIRTKSELNRTETQVAVVSRNIFHHNTIHPKAI